MQKFSFPKTESRQFKFSPKTPYDLVAERSEATSKTLQFPDWLSGQEYFRTKILAMDKHIWSKNSLSAPPGERVKTR